MPLKGFSEIANGRVHPLAPIAKNKPQPVVCLGEAIVEVNGAFKRIARAVIIARLHKGVSQKRMPYRQFGRHPHEDFQNRHRERVVSRQKRLAHLQKRIHLRLPNGTVLHAVAAVLSNQFHQTTGIKITHDNPLHRARHRACKNN